MNSLQRLGRLLKRLVKIKATRSDEGLSGVANAHQVDYFSNTVVRLLSAQSQAVEQNGYRRPLKLGQDVNTYTSSSCLARCTDITVTPLPTNAQPGEMSVTLKNAQAFFACLRIRIMTFKKDPECH